MGGVPQRSADVVAEPDRAHARCEGGRFTSARTTCRHVRVPGIAGEAVERRVGVDAEAEIGEVGAGEGDRPGGAHAGHGRRVDGRPQPRRGQGRPGWSASRPRRCSPSPCTARRGADRGRDHRRRPDRRRRRRASASSASSLTMALSWPLTLSTRTRWASTTSRLETSPPRIRPASSNAPICHSSLITPSCRSCGTVIAALGDRCPAANAAGRRRAGARRRRVRGRRGRDRVVARRRRARRLAGAPGRCQLRQRLQRRGQGHRLGTGRSGASRRVRHRQPDRRSSAPRSRCSGSPPLVGLALAAATTWWLLAVGVACIAAAWGYTGGPSPYGYWGSARCSCSSSSASSRRSGTTYVAVERVTALAVVAGCGVGCLACALLVVNNLRDIPTDTAAGKRTLAVRLGDPRTRSLFVGLVVAAFAFAGRRRGLASAGAPRSCWRFPSLPCRCRAVVDRASGPALIAVLGATGRAQLAYGSAVRARAGARRLTGAEPRHDRRAGLGRSFEMDGVAGAFDDDERRVADRVGHPATDRA